MTKYRWSEAALTCYENKFKCKGCANESVCKSIPIQNEYHIMNMKYAVLQLIALYGKPKESEVWTQYQEND